MKKNYFLTAVFENKFGKAKKYFDGDSWHWMLNSDQPQLYEAIEEAKKKARALQEEDLVDLSIKEVNVYEGVWEHKIPKEEIQPFLQQNGQPRAVIFYQEQKKVYLFLSKEKQWATSVLVEGLYCVDRKQDGWIYCEKKPKKVEKVKEQAFLPRPEVLICASYHHLSEAKAMMVLLDEEPKKLEKVDSLLLLMKKMIPLTLIEQTTQEQGFETSTHKLIQRANQRLAEAKQSAVALGEEKQTVENIKQLQFFCERIV